MGETSTVPRIPPSQMITSSFEVVVDIVALLGDGDIFQSFVITIQFIKCPSIVLDLISSIRFFDSTLMLEVVKFLFSMFIRFSS